MFDEQTGSLLLPVTHAIQLEWQSDMDVNEQKRPLVKMSVWRRYKRQLKSCGGTGRPRNQNAGSREKTADDEAVRKANEEEVEKEAAIEAQQTAAKQQEEEQRQAAEDAASCRAQFIESRRATEAIAPVASLEWLKRENFLDECFLQFNLQMYQTNVFQSEFFQRRMRYTGQVKRVIGKSNLAIFEFQTFAGVHLAVQAELQPGMVRSLRAGKFATVAGTISDWRQLPGNTRVEGIDGQGMILDLSGVEVVPEEIKPVANSRTCPARPVFETAVSTVLLPVRIGLDVFLAVKMPALRLQRML